MTFTKEQLIDQAQKNIVALRGAVERIPEASEAAVIHLRLAEITLAALTAEPVGFIHPFTPFTFGKSSGAIFKEETRHYYKPVYETPPAPVVPAQSVYHDADCDSLRPRVVNGVFVPRDCNCHAK